MTVAAFPDPEKGNAPVSTAEKQDSFVVDEQFEEIVQTLVPRTDDVNTPSLTFRVWIIGSAFCIVLGFVNQMFSFRTNPFAITQFVSVLLSYPMGKFMARVIPSFKVNLLGFQFDTNPGPFSVKEHVLIGIFGSTGAAGVYGTDNLVVQDVFYNVKIGPVWGMLFLLCTSTLGFGLSGMCRKFLVRPSHMTWPSILPSVALYTAFHKQDVVSQEEKDLDDNDGGKHRHISGLKVFGIGTLLSGIFYAVGPGFVSPMLAYLPLLCWFSPKDNLVLQRLGSPMWGVGIGSLTLDWTAIGSSAMSIPFWAAANVFLSSVFWMWIVVPIAWLNNWFGQPDLHRLSTAALMDKDGQPFQASDIVDSDTKMLIPDKFDSMKPFYMSPFFALVYGGSMATFTSAVTHTIVWYGKDIVKRFRASKHEKDSDIHCQLIDKYPEVPDMWYNIYFVGMLIVTIITCQFSGIELPWWGTLLAIAVSVIGTVPIAIVLATTGVALYMNVIAQFVWGLVNPGFPLQTMAFKSLGVMVSLQALTLLSDLKLGHYMKIPPRHVFVAQTASQIMACFFCWLSMELWIKNPEHAEWIKANGAIEGPGQRWGGYDYNVFYNASLIWGAIGPIRFFFESVYSPVIVGGLLIGLATPIVFWLCSKVIKGPIPWHLIQSPLLFQVGNVGINQGTNFSSFLVSLFFQFYMYRYRQAWWKRYNYLLATALDVGAAIVALILIPVQETWSMPTWALNQGDSTDTAFYGDLGDWCKTSP